MRVLTAVDTIHKYVPNIPTDDSQIEQVNGYVTGSPDIRWTVDDWRRFPHYTQKTIAQLPTADPDADILDVETGAATDPEAVTWVQHKHSLKQPAHIYVDVANVDDLYKSLASAKELEQTYLWLANWNLDEAEASALLGTEFAGFRVEMVQWASPSSNPDTLLPGTKYTLHDCGCDLSVAIPFSAWKEPAVHLVSVMAVATYSDGSKKSWSV